MRDRGYSTSNIMRKFSRISTPEDCRRLCTSKCHIWLWIRSFCVLYPASVMSSAPTGMLGSVMGTKNCVIEGTLEDSKVGTHQIGQCPSTCPVHASCSTVGTVSRCNCDYGYYHRARNNKCVKITKVFKSDFKMRKTFFPSLGDSTTKDFKSLATQVEKPLLNKLKQSLLDVEAVEVTGFRKGSVIAEFDIIFTNPESQNTTLITVQEAVLSAVTNSTFNGTLNVNISYIPVVTEVEAPDQTTTKTTPHHTTTRYTKSTTAEYTTSPDSITPVVLTTTKTPTTSEKYPQTAHITTFVSPHTTPDSTSTTEAAITTAREPTVAVKTSTSTLEPVKTIEQDTMVQRIKTTEQTKSMTPTMTAIKLTSTDSITIAKSHRRTDASTADASTLAGSTNRPHLTTSIDSTKTAEPANTLERRKTEEPRPATLQDTAPEPSGESITSTDLTTTTETTTIGELTVAEETSTRTKGATAREPITLTRAEPNKLDEQIKEVEEMLEKLNEQENMKEEQLKKLLDKQKREEKKTNVVIISAGTTIATLFGIVSVVLICKKIATKNKLLPMYPALEETVEASSTSTSSAP